MINFFFIFYFFYSSIFSFSPSSFYTELFLNKKKSTFSHASTFLKSNKISKELLKDLNISEKEKLMDFSSFQAHQIFYAINNKSFLKEINNLDNNTNTTLEKLFNNTLCFNENEKKNFLHAFKKTYFLEGKFSECEENLLKNTTILKFIELGKAKNKFQEINSQKKEVISNSFKEYLRILSELQIVSKKTTLEKLNEIEEFKSIIKKDFLGKKISIIDFLENKNNFLPPKENKNIYFFKLFAKLGIFCTMIYFLSKQFRK